jgi:hypothetical protein
MQPTKPIKRGEGILLRSNKPLSEFACLHLGFFVTGHYKGSGKRTQGNTTVVYQIEDRNQLFKVFLFDEEVLSILMDDWKFASVRVSFTSFYDKYGQPTLTTCERLNALLDRLGAYQAIPTGVRVFRDHGAKLTYLGRGDDKIAVGEEYATSVFIRPNVDRLDIVGSLVEHDIEKLEALL